MARRSWSSTAASETQRPRSSCPFWRPIWWTVALASIEGRLDRLPIEWGEGTCVGVVMASEGYPGDYATGHPIRGLEDFGTDVLVFHGGTRCIGDSAASRFLSDGGRVLTVVGHGSDLAQARAKVYDNIERIRFPGAHYRRDIGLLKQAAT